MTFNLKDLKNGDFVTLACGLGFVVATANVVGDTVAIEMSRIDKKSGTHCTKRITVTEDGYYIATEEPTMFDIVRVSDRDRNVQLTDAGMVSRQSNVDLHKQLYMASNRNILMYKVRTRNNYWSNVISVDSNDPEGRSFTLGLEQLNGGPDSHKYVTYTRNGLTLRSAESDGTFYDAFDIIEVQGL
ncbi:hypothetical protein EAb13_CDS0032 [Acinetobacter phage EAb13]|nr:hypothetical protein EAb13_CDS0032 [Acinetobacter phage EAb13]